jgi:hypothetical protein
LDKVVIVVVGGVDVRIYSTPTTKTHVRMRMRTQSRKLKKKIDGWRGLIVCRLSLDILEGLPSCRRSQRASPKALKNINARDRCPPEGASAHMTFAQQQGFSALLSIK